MLQLQGLISERRQWSPVLADPDCVIGTAMPQLLIATGISWPRLRARAKQLAREADKTLVTVRFAALVGESWRGSDREINRLFSHPAKRDAVVVIRSADALLAAPESPRFSYLLERIAAHRGKVILDARMKPTSLAGFSRFDIEFIAID